MIYRNLKGWLMSSEKSLYRVKDWGLPEFKFRGRRTNRHTPPCFFNIPEDKIILDVGHQVRTLTKGSALRALSPEDLVMLSPLSAT
ncbi:hypothetical protein Hanom_Chr13g01225261 [Helianthus anomalus]